MTSDQNCSLHITLRLTSAFYSTVHAVSLPMNEIIGNVLLGSLNGSVTGGVSLVPGQVGNALYMSDDTGKVDLGFHQSQCFYNPDSCSQGVTFAMWIKRDHGAQKGYLLNIGGSSFTSRGNWRITTAHVIELIHKSLNAPVLYPTMLHSEQKCAHFCSKWNVVGYETSTFWDLWHWAICVTTTVILRYEKWC